MFLSMAVTMGEANHSIQDLKRRKMMGVTIQRMNTLNHSAVMSGHSPIVMRELHLAIVRGHHLHHRLVAAKGPQDRRSLVSTCPKLLTLVARLSMSNDPIGWRENGFLWPEHAVLLPTQEASIRGEINQPCQLR
jgi:hypothetical protein